MTMPPVAVEWADPALDALRRIGSRTTQEKIIAKAGELAHHSDPAQLGKPLQDELRGYHRLSYGRYRIIYRVRSSGASMGRIVQIVYVGIRKAGDKRDVYEQAEKLRRRGLI